MLQRLFAFTIILAVLCANSPAGAAVYNSASPPPSLTPPETPPSSNPLSPPPPPPPQATLRPPAPPPVPPTAGSTNADQSALLALASSLTGLWNTSQAICSWAGVTCDASLRTSGINLRGKLIRLLVGSGRRHPTAFGGSIPTGFGALSALTSLDLGANGLVGWIPADIGNLSELTSISLDSNSLTGSIPASFSSLVNLRNISLGSNSLSGGLSPLANLQKIISLDVSSNAITGSLPAALRAALIANDASVNVKGNAAISECALTDNAADCSALTAASAAWNGAVWSTGRGTAFCTWAFINCTAGRVTSLALGGQSLVGSFPASLGGLTELRRLDLSKSSISGSLPDSFASLTKLQMLLLDNNLLSGTIPPSLKSLPAATLVNVTLNGNPLFRDCALRDVSATDCSALVAASTSWGIWGSYMGTAYCGWPGVTCNSGGRVTNLDLSGGKITTTGTIPPAMGGLTAMTTLSLRNNTLLSGIIPAELAGCAALRQLLLDSTALTGTIPAAVRAQFSSLPQENVTLFNTSLRDCTLAESAGDCPALRALGAEWGLWDGLWARAGGTPVCGNANGNSTLWTGVSCTSGRVVGLSVPNQNLTGRILDDVGALTMLAKLDLSWNPLGGTLPASMFSLPNLAEISLSHNWLLGGTIPTVGNLPSLVSIRMSDNDIQGTLPIWLYQGPSLKYMWLSNNRFSGTISSAIIGLQNLTELALSTNMLTGDVPQGLAKLSSMTDLYLYFNCFNKTSIVPRIGNKWTVCSNCSKGVYFCPAASPYFGPGGGYCTKIVTYRDFAQCSSGLAPPAANNGGMYNDAAGSPLLLAGKRAFVATFSSCLLALLSSLPHY